MDNMSKLRTPVATRNDWLYQERAEGDGTHNLQLEQEGDRRHRDRLLVFILLLLDLQQFFAPGTAGQATLGFLSRDRHTLVYQSWSLRKQGPKTKATRCAQGDGEV